MFEAYITNLGKYNEGELRGEYLKFPATTEEVQALLSRIGIDGVMYEEIFITDYKTDISGLCKHLGEYESIDELNYLASMLEELNEWELEKFSAAVACGEHTGSSQDLINLAQNLDCYEYYPDVNDYDDFGRYLIDELGYEEIPKHLVDYFDYESYGENYVINQSSVFTEHGFVFRNDDDFEEVYKGRADLPAEHKIFAYPPPEKSIQKSLANYAQAISNSPTHNSPTSERLQPAHAEH
jgi:hypothetical protein